jgi:hypothetical protein
MYPGAAAPAAAIDPPSPATAQLAAQVRQMEVTCSALNERLATLRSADHSPQRDAQGWERERVERERVERERVERERVERERVERERVERERVERERVERELQRRDSALVHATCAAAKASGLAEHYKSQTDELRRRYAQLQACVRDESRRGTAVDRLRAEAGVWRTQEPGSLSSHLPSSRPLAHVAVQTLSCEQWRPSEAPHPEVAPPSAAVPALTALHALAPAPMGPGDARAAAAAVAVAANHIPPVSVPFATASGAASSQSSPAGEAAGPEAAAALFASPSGSLERLVLAIQSELATIKAALASSESELAATKAALFARQTEVATAKAIVSSKDSELAAAKAAQAAQWGELAAARAALASRETELTMAETTLASREDELAAARREAVEKEARWREEAEARRAVEKARNVAETRSAAAALVSEVESAAEATDSVQSGGGVSTSLLDVTALREAHAAAVARAESADAEARRAQAAEEDGRGRVKEAMRAAQVAREVLRMAGLEGNAAAAELRGQVQAAAAAAEAARAEVAQVQAAEQAAREEAAGARLAEQVARAAEQAARAEAAESRMAEKAARAAEQVAKMAEGAGRTEAAEARAAEKAARTSERAARVAEEIAKEAEGAAKAAAGLDRAAAITARQEADDMMVRAGAAAERAMAAMASASDRERLLLRELQSCREEAVALVEIAGGGAESAVEAERGEMERVEAERTGAAEAERLRLCARLDAVTAAAARGEEELGEARVRIARLEASDAAAGIRAREAAAALERERGRVRVMRERLRELSGEGRGSMGSRGRGSGESEGRDTDESSVRGSGKRLGGGSGCGEARWAAGGRTGSEEAAGARAGVTSAIGAVPWESSEGEETESTNGQSGDEEEPVCQEPTQRPPSPPSPPAWDTPPALGIRVAEARTGFAGERGAAVSTRSAAQAAAVVEAWASGHGLHASGGQRCCLRECRSGCVDSPQREARQGRPSVAPSRVRRGASAPSPAASPRKREGTTPPATLPRGRAGNTLPAAGVPSQRAGTPLASGRRTAGCDEACAVRAAATEAARLNREEAAAGRTAVTESHAVGAAVRDLEEACQGLRRKVSEHSKDSQEARALLASSRREVELWRGKLEACEDRRAAAEARRHEEEAAATAARSAAAAAQSALLAAQEELCRLRSSHQALTAKVEFLTSRLQTAVEAKRQAELAAAHAAQARAPRVDSPPVLSRSRAARGRDSSADHGAENSILLSACAAVRSSADASREEAIGVQGAQGGYILELERHVRHLEHRLARAGSSHPLMEVTRGGRLHSSMGGGPREGQYRMATRIDSLEYGSQEESHLFLEPDRRPFLCAPLPLCAPHTSPTVPSAATLLRSMNGARPCSPPLLNQQRWGLNSLHPRSASSPTTTALRLLHAAIRASPQPPYATGSEPQPMFTTTGGDEASLGLSAADAAPWSHFTSAAALDAPAGRAPSSPAMWQRHSAAATPWRAGGVSDALPLRRSASASSIERKSSELVRVALAELAAM